MDGRVEDVGGLGRTTPLRDAHASAAGEAPLEDVELVELQREEEMVDAGGGVFITPATAGPGITFRPLMLENVRRETVRAGVEGGKRRSTRALH